MAKERSTNLRQDLILAGIEEINTYGANDFFCAPCGCIL